MGLGFSLRNLSFRWNLCSEISKGIPRALPTPQRPGDPLLHPGGPCRAAPRPPRAGGHQQRQQAGAFSPACRLCGPRRGSPLQTGRGRAAAWEPPSRNRQRRGPAAARGPQGGRNWGEWAPGRAGDGEGLRPPPPRPAPRSLCPPRVHRRLPCKQEVLTPSWPLAGAGSLPLPRGTILIHGKAAVGTPRSLRLVVTGRTPFLFSGGSPTGSVL